jgi:ABC-type antimicrobial peptide transport system permease subunit
MFKTRPMRTFLTILGVGVGIGTVLFLVSLGYGLQNIILNRITTADSLLSFDVTSGAAELVKITSQDVESIKQIDNVAEVSPVISMSGQITVDEFTGDTIIMAVDNIFFRLDGIMPTKGSLFSSDNAYEAVITKAGAMLFNLTPDQIIGKEISLSLFIPQQNQEGQEEHKIQQLEQKYKVVGVLDDESSSLVYIPRQTIAFLGINNYARLKVKVTDNKYMQSVREQIMNKGFVTSALSDTIEQANKIFRVVQIVLALFGLVALIVSAIGMFNTMTIALLERTNEIGIMRAIGIIKKDIRRLFLVESALMGFLGGVGGVAIGYAAGEAANAGLNLLARNFGGQVVDLFYRPLWFIIFIIIFSTLVGILTGIYPSIRAARLNPLDALRYK